MLRKHLAYNYSINVIKIIFDKDLYQFIYIHEKDIYFINFIDCFNKFILLYK